MELYYFEGTARKRGAIGITHPFNAEVRAENLRAAHIALYDNWEQISISFTSKLRLCPQCNKAARTLYAEQAGNTPEVYACKFCAPAMWRAVDAVYK